MRRAALAAWWLVAACASPYERFEGALARYEKGRALMEEGRPLEAADLFRAAAELDPGSSALPAWEARARLGAGDPEGALATLESASARGSTDIALAYDRAALLVRLGRLDEGASLLDRVLAANPALAEVADQDPELAPLRQRPDAKSLFRRPDLVASLVGEAGSILVGDTYDLVLRVGGARGVPLRIEAEDPSPRRFRPLKVVEEARDQARFRARRLEWALQALEAGERDIGPWRLSLQDQVVELPSLPCVVLSPSGRGLAVSGALPTAPEWLLSPLDVIAAHEAPALFLQGPWVVAVLDVDDTLDVDPASAISGWTYEMELREAGREPRRAVLRYRQDLSQIRASILRGGREILATDLR